MTDTTPSRTELAERIAALEASIETITGGPRVHPVRDELTNMRDVHGVRLAAIEARLTGIEGDLNRGFDSLGAQLGAIAAAVARIEASGPDR